MTDSKKTTNTHDTAFGSAVSDSLTANHMTSSDLTVGLSNARRKSVTRSYVSQLVTGKKLPDKEWVDLIADVLNISGIARTALYDAAKTDVATHALRLRKFDVDLTKK